MKSLSWSFCDVKPDIKYDNHNYGIYICYFFEQLIENNLKNLDREVDMNSFRSEI